MANTNHVESQYVGTRTQRGAVWLTHHGADEVASVSAGAFPADGSDAAPYRQVLEGTVLAKRDDLGLHYPLAYDSAQGAVAAANVIPVADVFQFAIGQYVELPTSVATDATRFRKVTAIDYDAGEITVDGAAFSLSSGDLIEVDPGRSVDFANGAVAASTALTVDDGSKFAVGDTLEFDGDTAKTITAIAGNDLTLSGAITIADNSIVVSNSDGQYKVTNKTVTIDHFMFTPKNTFLPCRPHGRVKEVLLIGLTPTAKAALAGLIIFDQRTLA